MEGLMFLDKYISVKDSISALILFTRSSYNNYYNQGMFNYVDLKPYPFIRRLSSQSFPGAQILSISCGFWENMEKSYVGAPPPLGSWHPLLGEILDPPLKSITNLL